MEEEVIILAIENEIRLKNATMADLEENIIKNGGTYQGEDLQAEDVCQVVLKQTSLANDDSVFKSFILFFYLFLFYQFLNILKL